MGGGGGGGGGGAGWALSLSKNFFSTWAFPDLCRELGRVSNFNQSINGHHQMKDYIELGHLAKFDAFRMNRDQVMDLQT